MSNSSNDHMKAYRQRQAKRIDYYMGAEVYAIIQHYQAKYKLKAGETIDFLVKRGNLAILESERTS